MHEQTRIWSLYKITNKINNKNYIGQAQDYQHRWADHKRAVLLNKPTQIIHHALIKYGLDNFEFEVIASCKTQEDANETETQLVAQYNSFVGDGYGYNATYGGMNAPKTEAWHQAMQAWRASLTPEEKAAIAKKQSAGLVAAYEREGNWNLGAKRTEEQKARITEALKNRDYDPHHPPEVRQRMSEAHIGLKDSEETKIKKSIAITEAWERQHEEKVASGELKCNAPGCGFEGAPTEDMLTYIIVDGVRYCSVHGQRLKRTGFLELQPRSSHNKINLTEDQINMLKNDIRSNSVIAKELGVSTEIVRRWRQELNPGFVFKTIEAHNKISFTDAQMQEILHGNIKTKTLAKQLGVSYGVIKRLRDKLFI